MYFLSIGLLIKRDEAFVSSLDAAPDLTGLTWRSMFADNLLPVTIGNIIGGALLVGAVYWFVFLRGRRSPDVPTASAT
jgi:formate/nitrite transporter FocA (FNT family)